MSPRYYDAHNHLQDERFGGRQAELLAMCARVGVAAMVVNGSCEEDWPQVLALARISGKTAMHGARNWPVIPGEGAKLSPVTQARLSMPQILPSFGYHPWYIHERTANWEKNLTHFLDQGPSAVGEIGLDRWKAGLSYAGQEEVFVTQLRLAAERALPVSIHCLKAWGRMLEILKSEPRPVRGFLLHSYGGPKEMISSFVDLGAYFSLPGFYAHARKERQREAFRHVPVERLLIETDAPDQQLPELGGQGTLVGTENWLTRAKIHSVHDLVTREALNHPANLAAVYAFAADLFGETVESMAVRVEQNFLRLFGDR